MDKTFDGIPFNAKMAKDDPAAAGLLQQPGADGFSVDTQPLFQVGFTITGKCKKSFSYD